MGALRPRLAILEDIKLSIPPPRPPRPSPELVARAEGGDPGAGYDLALALDACGRHGEADRGTAQADRTEARAWRRRAAEGGHLEAMVELAWDLGGQSATAEDREERVAWLRQAAERGHAEAMRLYGGVLRPTPEGRRWLMRSSDAGRGQALIDLTFWPAADDPTVAAEELAWVIGIAERGDALAMRLAARRLREGAGDRLADARAWLERAAAAGDAPSRSELAALVVEEGGDPAAALRLAVEALGTYHCKQRAGADVQAVIARYGGMARAQLLLARRFDAGDGLAPDASEALRWYMAAQHAPEEEPEAGLEATLAAIKLLRRHPGTTYRGEYGDTQKPRVRDLLWKVRQGAERLAMSRFHFWGADWHPALAEALLPALQALTGPAEGGDPQAQFELAWFLKEGLGCPRLPVRADRWMECAASRHLVAAFDAAAAQGSAHDEAELLARFEPFLVLAARGPLAWGIPVQEGEDTLRPFWRDARARWLATNPTPAEQPRRVGAVDNDSALEAYGERLGALKEAFREAIGPANNLFVVPHDEDEGEEGTLAISVDGEPANRLARRLAAEAAPAGPPPPPVPPMVTYRRPRDARADNEPPLEIWFEGRLLARFGTVGRAAPAAAERGRAVAELAETAAGWCGEPRAFLEGRGVRAVAAIAAASMDPTAQLQVAYAFLYGRGVARDVQAACVWFGLAAASGSAEARIALEAAKEHEHRDVLADSRVLREGITFAWWLATARKANTL